MYSEPVQPATAIEEYLTARGYELADETIQNHRYRLKQFRLWAEEVGLEDIRELIGRHCEQFRLAREEDDLAPITIRNQMMTLSIGVRVRAT